METRRNRASLRFLTHLFPSRYRRTFAPNPHPDGSTRSRGIFYRVRGFRCSTGLAGSEGFCIRGRQHIALSTRSDDHFPF